MKEIGKMMLKKALENYDTRMETYMKVNSKTTRERVQEHIHVQNGRMWGSGMMTNVRLKHNHY
jgi:hypothetical protein